MVALNQKKDFLIFLSLCLITSCILSGCSSKLFSFGRSQKSIIADEISTENHVKIVDPKRLREGGSLYIVPFVPGQGVEANTEVNKIALMLVKGLTECLREGSIPYVILSPEDAKKADMILSGHITRFEKTKGVKNWIPGQKSSFLEVSGKMRDEKTNGLILHFRVPEVQKKQTVDFNSWGYELGRQIGKEILNNI